VNIASERYDKSVGDVADVLNLTLKVVAQAAVVGGEDANTLARSMLESMAPEGYVLYPESITYYPPEGLQVDGLAARFMMRASGVAWANISEAEVLNGILGKPESEALSFLSERWEYSQPPRLEVKPEWLGRVPWMPYRVALTIDKHQLP